MSRASGPVGDFADDFVRVRRFLDANRADLARRAVPAPANNAIGLRSLVDDGWIPDSALRLEQVEIRLRDTRRDEDVTPVRTIAAEGLGLFTGSPEPRGYAQTIAALDAPPVWFDGPSYRLLNVFPGRGLLVLELGLSSYFEGQDTSEVLAFEVAARCLSGESEPLAGPVRRAAVGPFTFARRCATLGVNVLTIRSGESASFFMHRRSPTGAGPDAAMHHVIPAGEFQPSSQTAPQMDLVLTIAREYVEEFLGEDEYTVGDCPNAAEAAPSGHLARVLSAIRCDTARARFLGIGLDPLTWKPEALFACVWPEGLFDEIFSEMVTRTHEGVLVTGTSGCGDHSGIAFTAKSVDRYLERDDIFPGAHSCLSLAWRRRHTLGL